MDELMTYEWSSDIKVGDKYENDIAKIWIKLNEIDGPFNMDKLYHTWTKLIHESGTYAWNSQHGWKWWISFICFIKSSSKECHTFQVANFHP